MDARRQDRDQIRADEAVKAELALLKRSLDQLAATAEALEWVRDMRVRHGLAARRAATEGGA